VATDAAGNAVARRHQHPFGELDGSPASGTGPGFGGKPFDELSGLYYFQARWYAPELGRFVSPDPLALSAPAYALTEPQLHNPYVYAINNPMVYLDPSGLSLLGAALGGLVGGLVGGVVFVLTAGNPLLAGLAGGFAGGAVAGAIDGGVKGAVIGGVLGAALGGLGGAMVWGASGIGFLIGRQIGQSVAAGLAGYQAGSIIATTIPFGLGTIYGAYQAVQNNNWETLAGIALGMVGGLIGSSLTNRVIMKGIWSDPNKSARVRQILSDVEQSQGGRVSFKNLRIEVDPTFSASEVAHQNSGTIVLHKPNIGDDYVNFRKTLAHELMHEIQEQTLPGFSGVNGLWQTEVNRVGQSYANWYQAEAEQFGVQFIHYSPEYRAALPGFTWAALPFLLGPATSEETRNALFR
jgi:RHS repeat-associated protein